MAKILSRKQFIQSQGATCINWYWSWSFINKGKKEVIFGAWEDYGNKDKSLIFSEEWQYLRDRKQAAYKQSREHIRLVEEEGYSLKTFPIKNSEGTGNGPRKIENFEPRLFEKKLRKEEGEWFAIDYDEKVVYLPEELDTSVKYSEGTSTKIYVNSY
ncbi:MAG: hypothetical protein F4073_05620 [Rhodobacteraceae bacterium]|nr:hypothetical protein [Paracoccaceae bacterium]